MRPFFAYRQTSLFIPGCIQGATIYLVCVRVCVTFVVFTDCESCTRPISTNPVSMEAGEYWLTHGTWFSLAVSRWSRSPGCCGFRGMFWMGRIFFLFFFPSFFPRTHTACCRYEAASCLIYLSTSTGARTGCHYLMSLSVCVCVCVTLNSLFLLIATAVRGRFPQTRYLWKRASCLLYTSPSPRD